jgi:hypothetical protein
VLRDAGGFLDVAPTILRLGEQNLLELSLTDDGVERASDARLGEEFLDVHEPDDLPADPVLGLTRTEDRPGDLDLGHGHRDRAGRVVDHELDLGHAESGPRRRAGEDHVGHLPAAQGTRSLLAESPADRVDEVGLAGPVRADDHRHAGHELQDRLVRERLEPADRDLSQEHAAGC